MSINQNAVLLGPYSRKQKLYLETEDGVAMEGEFVKFNPSKTSVLLHHVELVPFDGRTFEQYSALLSTLLCLRPLENHQKYVNPGGSDGAQKLATVTENYNADEPATVTENYNDLVLPEIDNSEEARQERAAKFEARKSSMFQKLVDAGLAKDTSLKKESMNVKTSKPVVTSSPACNESGVKETTKSADVKNSTDNVKNHNNFEKKNNTLEVNHVEETVTNGIYEALKLKANNYIIIDKPGTMLQSAMQDIEKRSVLGLSSHGADRGRLDRLSLLSVATDSAVYLLDVQALGKQVLTPTLIKALESKTVKKVTYDCRYLSDCLYYTHHIRLANVYDIQAADCVTLRCRKGSFPNRGRSLQEIVSQYLDLPAALLADKTNITNYKVWYQRPLQGECYHFASWQVVFLPELRTAIDKAFQNLMQNSMDVYLNHIRKMSRSDAVETMASRRQIPVTLLDAPFVNDA